MAQTCEGDKLFLGPTPWGEPLLVIKKIQNYSPCKIFIQLLINFLILDYSQKIKYSLKIKY